MAPHAAEELPSLRAQVKALRDVGGTPKQRASALDGLYTRTSSVLATLLPELANLLLLVPRKTRRLVRSVLDLLQMLADDTLAVLEGGDGLNTTDPHQAADLALWRSLHALARQLMISHLIAAPAPAGAWQQLHQTSPGSNCIRPTPLRAACDLRRRSRVARRAACNTFTTRQCSLAVRSPRH